MKQRYAPASTDPGTLAPCCNFSKRFVLSGDGFGGTAFPWPTPDKRKKDWKEF
jgi:hypothetical protein